MSTYKALRVNLSGTIIPAVEFVKSAELADGEVLVDVHYSSVNYKDALAITGKSRIMRTYPTTAGIDAAGVVTQSKDARFKVGDEVLVTGYGIGESSNGGLAEQLYTSADYLVKRPKELSLQDTMTLGTAGFTAAISIQRLLENGLNKDDGPVLVTGATGGVGSVAIHCLKQMGFEVHALTRKLEQSADYLKHLGADELIDYHDLERGEKPLEKAQYAASVDSVGGETLSWITRVIKPYGNIAACGLASGIHLNTTVMPFILRGVSLLGIDSVNYPMQKREAAWGLLAQYITREGLELILHEVIALDEVIKNVNALMDGKVTGRFVVDLKR